VVLACINFIVPCWSDAIPIVNFEPYANECGPLPRYLNCLNLDPFSFLLQTLILLATLKDWISSKTSLVRIADPPHFW
jgi:hypothetical protein